MSIEDPQDVPEQWRQHFKRQSIEFTYRDLDRNVEGVALNTIRRALQGIGTPSRRVTDAIAGALGITVDEFNATRARVNGDEPTTPFTLPTTADRLNKRERDAVLSIVNALLDARDRHDQPAEQPAQSDRPTPATRTSRPEDQKTGKPTSLDDRRTKSGYYEPVDLPEAADDRGPEDEDENTRARRLQDEQGEGVDE